MRPEQEAYQVELDGFQSTHPLRGATLHGTSRRSFYPDFNPRTPCGVRPRGTAEKSGLRYFNPRTPCGVRLRHAGRRIGCQISIHAPLAGCDRLSCGFGSIRSISIHAPLAGCDPAPVADPLVDFISIHAPLAGCDKKSLYSIGTLCYFNPRTPCGVRLRKRDARSLGFQFQSTHPLRGATEIPYSKATVIEFQSTHPLRGATVKMEVYHVGNSDFNPRTPCGVRPACVRNPRFALGISIHAPLAGCDPRR